MVNDKFRAFLTTLKKSENRTKILAALGIISVILILASEYIPNYDKTEKDDTDTAYIQYVQKLESQTEDILSSMSGVGKCKVMITLKNSDENVYAQNNDTNSSDSSYSESNEYIFQDSGSSNEPVVLKKYFPQVQGVVIVCEGADDVNTKEKIINSVASLYNISTSKITVSKINS